MSKRLRMLIRRSPDRFKTITSDNGTEFHDYASVEAATGTKGKTLGDRTSDECFLESQKAVPFRLAARRPSQSSSSGTRISG